MLSTPPAFVLSQDQTLHKRKTHPQTKKARKCNLKHGHNYYQGKTQPHHALKFESGKKQQQLTNSEIIDSLPKTLKHWHKQSNTLLRYQTTTTHHQKPPPTSENLIRGNLSNLPELLHPCKPYQTEPEDSVNQSGCQPKRPEPESTT